MQESETFHTFATSNHSNIKTMTTPNDFLQGNITIYLQPFFSGRGNHMMDELSSLCEDYKNFCNYENVRFQRILAKYLDLCKLYNVDSHDYHHNYKDLTEPVEPERKSVGSMEDYLEAMEEYRHKLNVNNWSYCRSIDRLLEFHSN